MTNKNELWSACFKVVFIMSILVAGWLLIVDAILRLINKFF